MPSPDRTLTLSYVAAATLLLHVLLVPLWATWLDRPADASTKTPLRSRCADIDRAAPPSNRPCLPGKTCPVASRAADEQQMRLTYLEEETPPEPPKPEPPQPEPEPLLQTVSAPVDPSQTLEEPDDARFAATTSTRTEKETIQRSNDLGQGGGPRTPSAGAATAPKSAPKSSRTPKPAATPKGLTAFEAALQRETFPPSQEPTPSDDASPLNPSADAQPLPNKGQPDASDDRLLTPEELVRVNPELIANHLPNTPGSGGGAIDYLNGVEEGDRTLLNRKRTSYATFFERVQSAIKNHWDPATLYRRRDPTGRVYGTQDRVTILNVTLNSDGSIASLTIRETCGLDFLDDEAVRAVRAAAPFPNPPEGLKDINGKIRFSFGFYFELSSNSTRLFRFR